jgi:hypothetical protein
MKMRVVGLNNTVAPGKYAIFADYDKDRLEFIEKKWRQIRAKHGLGPVHIIATGKQHYWALCFSVVSLQTFLEILFEAQADPWHAAAFCKLGASTIRLTRKSAAEKIRLVKTLHGGKSTFPESREHRKVFEKMFGLKLRAGGKPFPKPELALSSYTIGAKRASFYSNDYYKLSELPALLAELKTEVNLR